MNNVISINQRTTMKKIIVFVCAIVLLGAANSASASVGAELKSLAELSGSSNVGELISGVIYGNTSNPSGNGNGVLPSLAPGPWKCGNPADCAGPTTAGGSMGEFIAPLVSDGAASPDFANGAVEGPDFSN
jgi:hypothetical protein